MKVAYFERELPVAGLFEQVSLNRIGSLALEVVARATRQTSELDQPTSWQLIFLQSKANGCAYHGEELPQRKWDWPKNTWFQGRLKLRQLEPRTEKDSCGALRN